MYWLKTKSYRRLSVNFLTNKNSIKLFVKKKLTQLSACSELNKHPALYVAHCLFISKMYFEIDKKKFFLQLTHPPKV